MGLGNGLLSLLQVGVCDFQALFLIAGIEVRHQVSGFDSRSCLGQENQMERTAYRGRYQHGRLAGTKLTRGVDLQVQIAAGHPGSGNGPAGRLEPLQRHRRSGNASRQQKCGKGYPRYLAHAHGFSATSVGSFSATFSPAARPDAMVACSSLRGPTTTARGTNFAPDRM